MRAPSPSLLLPWQRPPLPLRPRRLMRLPQMLLPLLAQAALPRCLRLMWLPPLARAALPRCLRLMWLPLPMRLPGSARRPMRWPSATASAWSAGASASRLPSARRP